MKYAMAWTSRLTGSGKDNEEALRRALQLFSKWQPPAGTTFHQFVGRADAGGGYAIVETDDPAALLTGTTKFAPFNEFQIHPVVDIEQWAQAGQEGIDFRDSIN